MRRAIGVACVALCAAPAFARATQATQFASYNNLVSQYRKGSFERAASELRFLSVADIDEQVMIDWARDARRAERRDDLGAALMLHTEVLFEELASDPMRLRVNAAIRKHDKVLAAIHEQLRGYSRTTPILRTWYLMWEAFRQGFSLTGTAPVSDYLDEGLSAFPQDSDLQLAAGARHEMVWWNAAQNRHRDPAERSRGAENSLTTARRYFQRSIDGNPKGIEARVRLGRTLTVLGEYDAAREQLDGARAGDPAFEYLRLLFLGDLRERQKDLDGAVAAYEEAIRTTPSPQSARLAVAQVLHSLGRRADAARAATQAMDTAKDQNDPWWGYQRGVWWRLGHYLKFARGLATATAGGTSK